jgi:hypothetical protein
MPAAVDRPRHPPAQPAHSRTRPRRRRRARWAPGVPRPEELASVEPADLRRHGFSFTKSRTIIDVVSAIVDGDLDLEGLPTLDDDAAIERLVRVHVIGRWTAKYVLLGVWAVFTPFPATTSARTTSSGVCSGSKRRWITGPCTSWSSAGSRTRASSTSTYCSTRCATPAWWIRRDPERPHGHPLEAAVHPASAVGRVSHSRRQAVPARRGSSARRSRRVAPVPRAEHRAAARRRTVRGLNARTRVTLRVRRRSKATLGK